MPISRPIPGKKRDPVYSFVFLHRLSGCFSFVGINGKHTCAPVIVFLDAVFVIFSSFEFLPASLISESEKKISVSFCLSPTHTLFAISRNGKSRMSLFTLPYHTCNETAEERDYGLYHFSATPLQNSKSERKRKKP